MSTDEARERLKQDTTFFPVLMSTTARRLDLSIRKENTKLLGKISKLQAQLKVTQRKSHSFQIRWINAIRNLNNAHEAHKVYVQEVSLTLQRRSNPRAIASLHSGQAFRHS